jgi:hypothetical protein
MNTSQQMLDANQYATDSILKYEQVMEKISFPRVGKKWQGNL